MTSFAEFELRQPTRADREREVHWTNIRDFDTQPSVILTLQCQASSSVELPNHLQQAVTILRLFDLGSVALICYEMIPESLLEMPEVFTFPVSDFEEKYMINPAREERLVYFWQRMSQMLPYEGYGYGSSKEEISPINIAFQRYSDALVADNQVVERRITNVMMGLESLYLSNESSEISYRLRMRVAKVLGLLGKDPYKAKQAVNHAYSVRSSFSHGDNISKDVRKEIDKAYDGNLNVLLKVVLDLLRISIIFHVVAHEQFNKQSLVKLMEDAAIDDSKEAELKRLAESARDLLA